MKWPINRLILMLRSQRLAISQWRLRHRDNPPSQQLRRQQQHLRLILMLRSQRLAISHC
jgi:hypothetical protein